MPRGELSSPPPLPPPESMTLLVPTAHRTGPSAAATCHRQSLVQSTCLVSQLSVEQLADHRLVHPDDTCITYPTCVRCCCCWQYANCLVVQSRPTDATPLSRRLQHVRRHYRYRLSSRPSHARRAENGGSTVHAGPDLSVWRPWAGSLLDAPTHPQML